MSFKSFLFLAATALAAPAITFRDTEVQSQALSLQPAQAESFAQTIPKDSLQLHYTSNDTKAIVNIPKLTHQVVNAVGLNVQCRGGQATVTFDNRQAFDKINWPSSFLLVTYSPSCGTGLDGDHDILLVSNITKSSDTLSITAVATPTDLESVIDDETLINVDVGPGLTTRDTSGSKHLSWNKYSTTKIFGTSAASVSCLNCGSDASINLYASVSFSKLKLNSAKIGVNGNINAAAVFALQGKGSVAVPVKDTTLLTIPLEGIKVGKYLTLGPTFSVSVGGKVTLNASGQLQLGAKLKGSVNAEVDVVGEKSSGSSKFGIEPVYSAKGSLGAVLDIDVTNSLDVGIHVHVFKLKFDKSASLSDTADIRLGAAIGKKECKGVEVTGQILNKVFFKLLGKEFDINQSRSPQLKKCLKPKAHAASAVESVSDDGGDGGEDDDVVEDLEPSASVSVASATAATSSAVRTEATFTAAAKL